MNQKYLGLHWLKKTAATIRDEPADENGKQVGAPNRERPP
jgi:hypothetical protein